MKEKNRLQTFAWSAIRFFFHSTIKSNNIDINAKKPDLEKIEKILSKCYGRFSGLVQHDNTPLSQFCYDLVLCWCVLHTPDLTPPNMTCYTLDSTAGVGPLQVNLFFPGTYLHTWIFPIARVVLISFIPGFVMIIEWWYLINRWQTVISFLIRKHKCNLTYM